MEYRQAILRTYGLSEKDILGRLKICIDRQELLWDKNHSFHFIIHESALYSTLGTHQIQRVQLSRVERHIGAPNIKIGIIPFMSSLPNIDGHSFSVFGNDQLAIPVVGSEIWSKDAEIIVNHLKAFKQLERLAHYGDEARDLLNKAIDHFGRNSG